MSPRPSQDQYSPLVSSPFNPDGHAEIPRYLLPKTPSPGSKRRLHRSGEMSPTEMLMRHKAALAWAYTKSLEGSGEDISRVTGAEHVFCRGEKPSNAGVEQDRGSDFVTKTPVHRAHWEDDQEGEIDFFSWGTVNESAADDDDDDVKMRVQSESTETWLWPWSHGVLDLKTRFFPKDTSKMGFLAAGVMCIGSCLPVLALIASGSPSVGLWPLHPLMARGGVIPSAIPDE